MRRAVLALAVVASTGVSAVSAPVADARHRRAYVRHHDDIYADLAHCESTHRNLAGRRYQGYFQFRDRTWDSLHTGYARANHAPYSVQSDAARRLVERSGWRQFPACSRRLGVR